MRGFCSLMLILSSIGMVGSIITAFVTSEVCNPISGLVSIYGWWVMMKLLDTTEGIGYELEDLEDDFNQQLRNGR